jgi:ADP-ribosylglycohydrolase
MEGRAYGALIGLALGDALGMPTQSMSRAEIARHYGHIVGLVPAGPAQPIARGLPAGRVTDDTAQAVIMAQLVVDGDGQVSPEELAKRLMAWERDVAQRGELDLLGPSTKAALSGLAAGERLETLGRAGVTNGAAMRIAAVGIAHPPGPGLEQAVFQASRLTHNTHQALAAAAAVATAVSGGIEGWDLEHSLEAALAAARRVEQQGYWQPGGSFTWRWSTFMPMALGLDDATFFDLVEKVVGTSVLAVESVVASLMLVSRFAERPYHGLCAAARLGGDTDTIAAMAGAIWGASLGPDPFPTEALEQVELVNDLRLGPLAAKLTGLRNRTEEAKKG